MRNPDGKCADWVLQRVQYTCHHTQHATCAVKGTTVVGLILNEGPVRLKLKSQAEGAKSIAWLEGVHS